MFKGCKLCLLLIFVFISYIFYIRFVFIYICFKFIFYLYYIYFIFILYLFCIYFTFTLYVFSIYFYFLGRNKKLKQQALALQQEIKILSQLDHPNIIKYLGTEYSNKTMRIFLELANEGSVKDALTEFGKLRFDIIFLSRFYFICFSRFYFFFFPRFLSLLLSFLLSLFLTPLTPSYPP